LITELLFATGVYLGSLELPRLSPSLVNSTLGETNVPGLTEAYRQASYSSLGELLADRFASFLLDLWVNLGVDCLVALVLPLISHDVCVGALLSNVLPDKLLCVLLLLLHIKV
jgi:hypothetical protein